MCRISTILRLACFLVLITASTATAETALVATELGNAATPGVARSIAVQGDYAYVGYSDGGLLIFNVTDPSSPQQAGQLITSGSIWDVKLSGTLAYLAADSNGLLVVDVSDSTSLVVVGSYPVGDAARAVALDDTLVYLAAGLSGLIVISVADPANPVHVGDLGALDNALDVALQSDQAFVGSANGDLTVVDVTIPSAPSYAGHVTGSGAAVSVTSDGSSVYVCQEGRGWYVVDVATAFSPEIVVALDPVGGASDLALHNGYALIAGERESDYSWDGGFLAYQVGNPALPQLVGKLEQSTSQCIAVDADRAYLGYGPHLGLFDLQEVEYVPGDLTGDDLVTSSDIIYFINWNFKGQAPPVTPVQAADANCSGLETSADIIWLVNYVFKGGPEPGC